MSKILNFNYDIPWLIPKFILALIISIVLIFNDNNLIINKYIKSIVYTVIYPIKYVANQPIEYIIKISHVIQNNHKTITQYDALEKEFTQLKAEIYLHQKSNEKLKNLEALLKLAKYEPKVVTIAGVVLDNNFLFHKMTINKGMIHGVKVGQAVVNEKGFVGQVVSVEPFSAQVNLINYKKIIVPVQVRRTGYKTLLYGNMDLPFVSYEEDIKKNDIIETSGVDGNYPTGIPIAIVSKIQRQKGAPYYSIKAEPMVNVQKIHYVSVLALKN